MTDTTQQTAAPARPTGPVKRHPIRGILYGILLGLGAMMIAVGQSWAALGTWPPFIIFLVGVVIGFVWSMWGPAKKPKGPAPSAAAAAEEPPSPPAAADSEPEEPDPIATDDGSSDPGGSPPTH